MIKRTGIRKITHDNELMIFKEFGCFIVFSAKALFVLIV